MGGQWGYKGHVLNLPQDIQGFLNRLPPNVTQLPYLIIQKHGTENMHRDCRVRREKVLQAITWLKENNPFYGDIAIDYESLERLPEDGIPTDLPTVEDSQSNEQRDTLEEHAEEEIPEQSHSFLLLTQGQQSKQDAIRALMVWIHWTGRQIMGILMAKETQLNVQAFVKFPLQRVSNT